VRAADRSDRKTDSLFSPRSSYVVCKQRLLFFKGEGHVACEMESEAYQQQTLMSAIAAWNRIPK